MRFFSLLWSGVAVAALTSFVASAPVEEAEPVEPEISIIASFPDENPFGHVVNGERNKLSLVIENKSEQNVTIMNVGGAFFDVDTDKLIKNTTAVNYGVPLVSGTKVQLPYVFHSEFKPGDVRLQIWLNHVDGVKLYQVTAYDSVVTVVEPEISWFDYQFITSYLISGVFLAGVGYYAYQSFFPQTKQKKARKPAASAPPTATPTSPGGYEEEWIPAHHLKKTAGGKKGAASSGDELSGQDASGAEGKKKKGRK